MMQQPVRQQDRLVEQYLAAVAQACAGLPVSRREELVADLREHIAVARQALPDPSEADIRDILDRLGEPTVIAAEARVGEPADPMPALAVPVKRVNWTVVVISVVLATVVVMILVCVSGLLATGEPMPGGGSRQVITPEQRP